MRFLNMRIAYRLLVVVFVGALGLAIFTVVSLSNLRATLESERENKTREHVDVAQSLIRGIVGEATKAGRSTKEAQREALSALRAVRYGGNEYFWINDTAGMMLMHPTDKGLENTSVIGVKNSQGLPIFAEMIEMARSNGGGFYRYDWKSHDDAAPRAKIAYVSYLPEWNWVVGTGIYVDDIDALYLSQVWRLGGIGLITLVISVLAALMITRTVVAPLSVVVVQLKELVSGHLDIKIENTDRKDEIGAMTSALGSVQATLLVIAKVADEIAQGNLTASIEPRSPGDLLGLALKTVQANLLAIAGAADQIAQGNLTVTIEPRSPGDRLGVALKTMLVQLRSLVAESASTAKAVHDGATTISASVENQAASSNQLSSSVAEITSTMEELSASSSQISEHSGAVVEIANKTLASSKIGTEAMAQLAARMASIRDENHSSLNDIIGLGKTSKEISKVMTIINVIADQTKLIAFNAALEAASAGESGRRFSVVAAEIRRLADSVTDSTGEIESKVGEIQDSISRLVITSEKGARGISEGMEATAHAADRLSELVDAASKTASAAQQISLSTQQQKTAAGQVVIALREIVGSTHHTAQSMAQLSDVSRKMADLSSDMNTQVGRFRLGNETNRG